MTKAIMDTIAFAGPLEESQRSAFRAALRPSHLWSSPIFHGVVLSVSLGRALTHGSRTIKAEHLLLIAVSASILAFSELLFRHRFNRWWRAARHASPSGVSGSANADRLCLVGSDHIGSWKDFVRVETSDHAVVLLTENGSGFPLHRTMFTDETEWKQFKVIASSAVRLSQASGAAA